MKKENMRKVRIVRRRAVRVACVLVTLVMIMAFAAKVVSIGSKIVGTQIRMAYYYTEIDNLEAERAELQEKALTLTIPAARMGYQNDADACAALAQEYTEARNALRDSSDPMVAWAAKDGFELSVLFTGIGVFAGLALSLFGVYQLFGYVVKAEEKIFTVAVRVAMLICSLVFGLLHRCFYNLASVFTNERRSKVDLDDNAKSRRRNRKVVPFGKRRIG